MGYCPYMCIVCENIKDNGWECKNFTSYQKFIDNRRNSLNDVKKTLNLNVNLSVLLYDNRSTPTTFTVCPCCYRKYRYTKEKQNKICLKLYSKKKVNGKWIKLDYTKIK